MVSLTIVRKMEARLGSASGHNDGSPIAQFTLFQKVVLIAYLGSAIGILVAPDSKVFPAFEVVVLASCIVGIWARFFAFQRMSHKTFSVVPGCKKAESDNSGHERSDIDRRRTFEDALRSKTRLERNITQMAAMNKIQIVGLMLASPFWPANSSDCKVRISISRAICIDPCLNTFGQIEKINSASLDPSLCMRSGTTRRNSVRWRWPDSISLTLHSSLSQHIAGIRYSSSPPPRGGNVMPESMPALPRVLPLDTRTCLAISQAQLGLDSMVANGIREGIMKDRNTSRGCDRIRHAS